LAQTKLSSSQHPKKPRAAGDENPLTPHFFPQIAGMRQDMIEVIGAE